MERNSSAFSAAIETLKHDFHFPGHLLPGTAFIIMGVWWIWNAFKIYYENKEYTSDNFLSLNDNVKSSAPLQPFRATYNGELPGFIFCEGFYKVMYASFDLCCHLLVVFYGGDMTNENQHMTVYVLFILNGLVDVALHMKLCGMPQGSDYLAASAAWTGLGFLFISHKHAKTPIQIYYHSTLGWLSVAVGVVTLVQYKYDKNTLTSIVRGVCCAVVGTWLYQISFSFHNPFVAANQWRNQVHLSNDSSLSMIEEIPSIHHHQHSNENDNHIVIMQIMNAATILTWHFIIASISVVVLGIMAMRGHRGYKRIPCISCV